MNHLTAFLLLLIGTAATAGTPDIGDDINARLARAKIQQATAAATLRGIGPAAADNGVTVIGNAARPGGGGNGCTIAIGNVIEDKGRISTSARRETTVIVTGDVIQVGNNCR